MVNAKILDSVWTPVATLLRVRCGYCNKINEIIESDNIVKCSCGRKHNIHNYKAQWKQLNKI
jgi:hypothetical protein